MRKRKKEGTKEEARKGRKRRNYRKRRKAKREEEGRREGPGGMAGRQRHVELWEQKRAE